MSVMQIKKACANYVKSKEQISIEIITFLDLYIYIYMCVNINLSLFENLFKYENKYF